MFQTLATINSEVGFYGNNLFYPTYPYFDQYGLIITGNINFGDIALYKFAHQCSAHLYQCKYAAI